MTHTRQRTKEHHTGDRTADLATCEQFHHLQGIRKYTQKATQQGLQSTLRESEMQLAVMEARMKREGGGNGRTKTDRVDPRPVYCSNTSSRLWLLATNIHPVKGSRICTPFRRNMPLTVGVLRTVYRTDTR